MSAYGLWLFLRQPDEINLAIQVTASAMSLVRPDTLRIRATRMHPQTQKTMPPCAAFQLRDLVATYLKLGEKWERETGRSLFNNTNTKEGIGP